MENEKDNKRRDVSMDTIRKGDYFKDPDSGYIYQVKSIDWLDDSILATQWICKRITKGNVISISIFLDSAISRCKKIMTKEELLAELL